MTIEVSPRAGYFERQLTSSFLFLPPRFSIPDSNNLTLSVLESIITKNANFECRVPESGNFRSGVNDISWRYFLNVPVINFPFHLVRQQYVAYGTQCMGNEVGGGEATAGISIDAVSVAACIASHWERELGKGEATAVIGAFRPRASCSIFMISLARSDGSRAGASLARSASPGLRPLWSVASGFAPASASSQAITSIAPGWCVYMKRSQRKIEKPAASEKGM